MSSKGSYQSALVPSILIIWERGHIHKSCFTQALMALDEIDSIQEAEQILDALKEMETIKIEDGLCWLTMDCEQQYLNMGERLDQQLNDD